MMDHRLVPIRFIGEEVAVAFDEPPTLEKKPGCPDRFTWRDETFHIAEVTSEWSDYTRRGRFARNMRPDHASKAANRGSWGVGRLFFRVRVHGDRHFELVYDRAPRSAGDRKGAWFLRSELAPPPLP